MNTLISILVPVIVAYGFVRELQVPFHIKRLLWPGVAPLQRNLIRIKPLDCEKCLSFWLSLLYTLISTGSIATALAYACLSYGTALIVIKP